MTDLKSESPLVILRGHYDLIHDMNWSRDDNFMVSASADGSAKVWNLSEMESKNPKERITYTENDELFFWTQLMHPSFVYGAKFHPMLDHKHYFLATICFDQKVRIWIIHKNADQFVQHS
jgi:jouberin